MSERQYVAMQEIRDRTCEDCPVRRATKGVQAKAFSLLELLAEEQATTDDLEQFAEGSTNLAKCARAILEGECGTYRENPDYGYYVEQIESDTETEWQGYRVAGGAALVAYPAEVEGEQDE